MKKNKNPKDDKPKPEAGGAPPTIESPKPVNDDKLTFSYNSLIFDDYFISQERRFVRFFVEDKEPWYLSCTYGEFIEYQLYVWEAKNKIAESVKEPNQEVCVCDIAEVKNYERVDDMEFHFTIIDPDTKKTTEVLEYLPVFFVSNLLEHITVGGICKFDNKIDKK